MTDKAISPLRRRLIEDMTIRRGSGHSTSEGWFVVIGGDRLRVRVAASTSL